jgi:hypothetical protein
MTDSFAARVAEIDRRIREINPAIAAGIVHDGGAGDEARWERAGRWATLTLHDGNPPRLELTSHTGSPVHADDHPEALEIGFDDADVVDMIAQPVAALLAGAG